MVRPRGCRDQINGLIVGCNKETEVAFEHTKSKIFLVPKTYVYMLTHVLTAKLANQLICQLDIPLDIKP